MVFALGAGNYFDVDKENGKPLNEYEETILAKCIDTYIALCALRNPPKPIPRESSQENLADAFPTNANGPANATASMASPITPFSQSTLPS